MAAVARAAETYKAHSAPSGGRTKRARSGRRVRTRASMFSLVVLFLVGLALPFAYAGVYANLKKTSYSRSDLAAMCWKQKVENERLKVEIDRLSSPAYVEAAAARTGMVCATQYDYLEKSQTVASADRFDKR